MPCAAIDITPPAAVKHPLPCIGSTMSLAALPTALLIPPDNLVPLAIAGLLLARRWPRLGQAMTWVGLGGLFLLSLPVIANGLLGSLERGIALPRGGPAPQAVVILSAEEVEGLPGGVIEGFDAGRLTLPRLRAGALLARRTGLPVLVTGGVPRPGRPSLGAMMAEVLARDFATKTRWVEGRSQDTWQNAEYSAALLRASGIGRVYLVSDGWHLRRAMIAFRHFGIDVAPAPALLGTGPGLRFDDFLPHASAWQASYWAIHEWIGCAVYALRDRMG
jgi:uncharacterized SAM-binding protein YcdF (DUF218 family)